MRVLEIGDSAYISPYLPAHSDYYRTSKFGEAEPLSLRAVSQLSERLRRGDYDLVVYHINEKVVAPWHRDVPLPRKVFDTAARAFSRSSRTGWHRLHAILSSLSVPLVVIDTQDVPRITRTELAWLDRASLWFMRELPVNHLNLFLNLDRRTGDVINIQRHPVVSRSLGKLRSFSLGYFPKPMPAVDPALEKIHDVFYVGANHTTTVRSRGLEELRALRGSGLRIHLPEKRIDQDEYFRICAQSWLCWSPEGQGWDCHRHYEVLRMGSVPLINYPTIDRWQPLVEGEHCIFHATEPGGLERAIRAALRDPEKLRRINAQGREHIQRHHTRSQLARHVLAEAGLLTEAGPHWVESQGVS